MTDNKNEKGFYSVVFAGPNGSGKTSLIDSIKVSGFQTLGGHYQMPAYFINPDQVSKDLQGISRTSQSVIGPRLTRESRCAMRPSRANKRLHTRRVSPVAHQ